MKDIEEDSNRVLKGIESILPSVVERKSRKVKRMEIAVWIKLRTRKVFNRS